jgi:peroxiredoxin
MEKSTDAGGRRTGAAGSDGAVGAGGSADAAAAAAARSPRPRRGLLIGLGGCAAGLAAAGAWIGWRGAGTRGPASMPAHVYPVIDGRRLGPETLRGRVVLVNFWATSCAICVAEMPEFVALHEAYATRGLQVLAVAMPYDRPDHVLHFARTRRLPFAVALDPMGEAVATWGGVRGTPTTWLVAPDGRVAGHWVGRPDFARLRRDVEALLPAARG